MLKCSLYTIKSNIKDGTTELEKNKRNEFTDKRKKQVYACDKKGFTIDKITKNTYICSLYFFSGNGLIEEDPDPISASLLECELVGKKDKKKEKISLERDPFLSKKKKVRANRTKKHSEREICRLDSIVQYGETDFDEPVVGDVSTLSSIPLHK